MATLRARSGLALPLLFALTALVTFIALGFWQLDRKAWKEALIATLAQRTRAEPVELSGASDWSAFAQASDEFRHVKLTAEFLPVREAVVYATASPLRPEVKPPGYYVFAPVRVADGALVVVNRGFTPETRVHADHHAKPEGQVELIGALRWPEDPGWFVREHDKTTDVWFVRDHLGMTLLNRWGNVAPFYVELESPHPPDDFPLPGPLSVTLRNEHLHYAITWFSLALVVVVMFGLWLRSRRRRAHAPVAAPSSGP